MSAPAVQCYSHQCLELQETLLTDSVKVHQFFIGVVDYLNIADGLSKKYSSPAEEGLAVKFVVWNFCENSGEQLLLATIVCDRCFHFQVLDRLLIPQYRKIRFLSLTRRIQL